MHHRGLLTAQLLRFFMNQRLRLSVSLTRARAFGARALSASERPGNETRYREQLHPLSAHVRVRP